MKNRYSKDKVEELKKMLDNKQPEEVAQSPESALTKAEEEAQQNHDKFLRAIADFDNFKKRTAKEIDDLLQYGQSKIFESFVHVLDDFDRMVEHLPKSSSDETQNIVDGITLTHRHFLEALKKFGVTPLETENQMFDPHLHEAIGHIETDDQPEGAIVTSHRKGYKLHDRLLRPALVSIAKSKTKEEK